MRLTWMLYLACLCFSHTSLASIKLPYTTNYTPPLQVVSGEELIVSGNNTADHTVILVIRVDDNKSTGYSSRANIERVLPPGPFKLKISFAEMRTSHKRPLNLKHITKIIVFVGSEKRQIDVNPIEISHGFMLPEGSFGWDFGPLNQAVFPGFTAINTTTPGLRGEGLTARKRRSGDTLIQDGIIGIHSFETWLPNGSWIITFWSEELGEWEYLSHPLEQTITINNKRVMNDKYSPKEWIKQRYLRGYNKEAELDGDLWDLVGRTKGKPSTNIIEVTNERLSIKLHSPQRDGRYLSGVVAVPADNPDLLQIIQSERRSRFLSTWRTPDHSVLPTTVGIYSGGSLEELKLVKNQTELTTAPGTHITQDFWFVTPPNTDHTTQIIPAEPQAKISIAMRFGRWHYTRPSNSATLVTVSADHLSSDRQFDKPAKHLPRRVNLLFDIPKSTPPGKYRFMLQQGKKNQHNVVIDVLPISLPPPKQTVGVYLETQPQFGWFKSLKPSQAQSTQCDLARLKSLGLTGISAPFTTPTKDHIITFARELQRYYTHGFDSPPLAYTPIKRLAKNMPISDLAVYVSRLMATLSAANLPAPIWSIADEPSNVDQQITNLEQLANTLHHHSPGIQLAGHLNNPKDKGIIKLFDIALINQGFGVDLTDINWVREQGITPWLYNLSNPRIAAGMYLWHSDVNGYLQWHARMPTGDPYDPTDGREDDVQFLYPSAEPCPDSPDLHADLIGIVEGINDLRWLTWLENTSQSNEMAAALLNTINKALPETWQAAELLTNSQASSWRAQIMEFAKQPESDASWQ